MTQGCINFVEYTGCDDWANVNCVPNMADFVEVTCAPGGQFDDGCWAEIGMNGPSRPVFKFNILTEVVYR